MNGKFLFRFKYIHKGSIKNGTLLFYIQLIRPSLFRHMCRAQPRPDAILLDCFNLRSYSIAFINCAIAFWTLHIPLWMHFPFHVSHIVHSIMCIFHLYSLYHKYPAMPDTLYLASCVTNTSYCISIERKYGQITAHRCILIKFWKSWPLDHEY